MPPPSSVLPEVISLGCRLNIAESETIRTLLGCRDAVVVNSCAVTNEAVAGTSARGNVFWWNDPATADMRKPLRK